MYSIIQNAFFFGCNEFDDVEVRVVNSDNVKEAQEKAAEFLAYLKENGFSWWS